MAFAVVVLAHHRRERSFDGGDDLGQRDVLGRPGEHVPAADAPLRPDQTRALHGEEDLFQVRLGEARSLGDLLHRGRPVLAVQRQRQEGTSRVVAPGRDLHAPMVARRRAPPVPLAPHRFERMDPVRPDYGGWGGRYQERQPWGEKRKLWTSGFDARDTVTSDVESARGRA